LGAWKRSYQGIAILSFTNVAWKEIEETIRTETASGEFLKHPHFIGTIDSFLNQYVFLPHAQNITGSKRRPDLVGPPINVWNAKGTDGSLGFLQFDNISFQQDGSIELINKRKLSADIWNKQRDNMLRTKWSLIKAGFATQSDALYISWLLIKSYPTLASAVATRFPIIIVDEAQDTCRMQMEILDHLVQAGLEKIMFVGDPDQSIFEWNRAEPALLLEKYEAWKTGTLELTENWRSSQKICNFT
jgi:superfamily I DNA/RNA helicase